MSCGEAKRKYKIIVDYASKKAIEKISKAGGEVTLKAVEKKTVQVKVPKSKSKDKKPSMEKPQKTKAADSPKSE